MELEDAYEQIYKKGTGWWTVCCTCILSMQSLIGALESNVSPLLAACTVDLGVTTPVQRANINSVASMGMLFGTLLLVPLADIVGRWRLLFWSSMGTALFAFASSAAQSYLQLLLFRAALGFTASSWPVAIDLLEEYVTPESRGAISSLVNLGWSTGAVLVNLVAWWLLPNFGWRGLLFFLAVVYVLNVLPLLFLVESPRWLLSQGRDEDAMDAVNFIASVNGTSAPCRKLMNTSSESHSLQDGETGNFKSVTQIWNGFRSLLRLEDRNMTMCVGGLWLFWNMAYQAVVIIDDSVLDNEGHFSTCSFNYGSIALLSTSEIAGALMVLPFIDRVDLGWLGGRRGMQVVPYVLGAVTAILCGLQLFNVWTFAFLTRAAISAGTGTSVSQLPELYNTKYRATATSAANLFGMLGSILAPYVIYADSAEQFFWGNLVLSLTLLASTAFVLGIPETAQTQLDGTELRKGFQKSEP